MHAYESIPAGRRTGAAFAALGWLAMLGDRNDEARKSLEAGVAAHPTDARVLDAMLALDLREKRVADSLERLDAAGAARPDDAALARLRARALAAANQRDEAAAAFGRALGLAPNDAATYDAIAVWLVTVKPEDAERSIAGLRAGAGPTRVAQGWVRAARGDRAGAIAAHQSAVEADPALPIARAALARALATSGQQLDHALALAREAHAARPHDMDIAWALAVAHLKRGQGEAALEALGPAIGSYPIERAGYGELLYTAALAFEDAGERVAAGRGAAIALGHVDERAAAPSWKAPAQALRARMEPKPKPPEVAQETAPANAEATPAPTTPAAATPPLPNAPAIDTSQPPSAPAPAAAGAPSVP